MVRLVDAHGAIGDTVLICKVADLPENHPENHTVGIRGQTWSRAVSISHSSLKVSPGGGINWHLRSMTVTRRQRARQDWQSRGSWVRVPSPPPKCQRSNPELLEVPGMPSNRPARFGIRCRGKQRRVVPSGLDHRADDLDQDLLEDRLVHLAKGCYRFSRLGKATSSKSNWIPAAVGMAISAPIRPSRTPPTRMAMIVIPGEIRTVWRITLGVRR